MSQLNALQRKAYLATIASMLYTVHTKEAKFTMLISYTRVPSSVTNVQRQNYCAVIK